MSFNKNLLYLILYFSFFTNIAKANTFSQTFNTVKNKTLSFFKKYKSPKSPFFISLGYKLSENISGTLKGEFLGISTETPFDNAVKANALIFIAGYKYSKNLLFSAQYRTLDDTEGGRTKLFTGKVNFKFSDFLPNIEIIKNLNPFISGSIGHMTDLNNSDIQISFDKLWGLGLGLEYFPVKNFSIVPSFEYKTFTGNSTVEELKLTIDANWSTWSIAARYYF